MKINNLNKTELIKLLKNFGEINKPDNPFCNACKEKDCYIAIDNTCAMLRRYLKNYEK